MSVALFSVAAVRMAGEAMAAAGGVGETGRVAEVTSVLPEWAAAGVLTA